MHIFKLVVLMVRRIINKRSVPKNFDEYVKPIDEKDFPLVGRLVTEPPTMDLYSFTGKMIIGNEQFALKINQLLLKGSNLKNTEWILGVVVYTGKDSKLMMNSQKSRTKRSRVEKELNIIIFFILIAQLFICLTLAMTMLIRDSSNDDDQDYYLGSGNSDEEFYINFFSYFLLLNTMIPISLIVTLEIIKVFQCIFMMWDSEMYSIDDDAGCHVSSTTINEELGQVSYIFSDKTGTLTQNMMVFKSLWVEEEIYGALDERIQRKASRIEQKAEVEYTFRCNKLANLLEDEDSQIGDQLKIVSNSGKSSIVFKNDREKAMEAIKLLSICHEWVPEKKTVDDEEVIIFQGPSPDDATLVDFAMRQGFKFTGMTDTTSSIRISPGTYEFDEDGGVEKTYKVHARAEFNSDRKRMSILFTDPDDGKHKLYIKGADSAIEERLAPHGNDKTLDFVKSCWNPVQAWVFALTKTWVHLAPSDSSISKWEFPEIWVPKTIGFSVDHNYFWMITWGSPF